MAENPRQSKYRHSYPGKRQRIRSPSKDREMTDNDAIYAEKLDKGEIRIMRLHRGSGSDVFKCDLRKIQLAASPVEQTPPYEALSYVWGSKEDPRHIYISGNRFAVTQNLFEALTYLRHPESDRTLWIDAICINQLDFAERTVQVRQMHQVYGNAKEVIAWIGNANADTHEIFDSMLPDMNWGPLGGVSFILGNERRTEREKAASNELANRPYWSRAWTFQEMKFATSLTIQCGVEKISYGRLHSLHINKQATARVRTSNSNGELVDRYKNNLDSKLPELTGDQDYPNYFLDYLLNRQCCDRRDNIFAFCNLFSQDLQQRIPINYEASAKEILLQSARAIIESTGSLYIFVIRGRQIPPESREEQWQKGMPSWCPYLAAQYDNYGLKPQNMPSIFTEKAMVSFYTNTKILVRGFVVGWIERSILPENVGSDDWTNEDYKQQFGFYTKCLELGLLSAPREKGEKSLQATTRTLLVDQDGDSNGDEDLIKYALGKLSDEPDENDAKDALYQIQRNIRSRQACSFQVSAAVIEALRSSGIPREFWLNPLAVVPRKAQWRDAICVISGCPLPIVLRRSGDIYHIIGEAFFDTGRLESVGLRIKLRDFIVE
ncbi:ankyrin het domain-containing protein [Fusarium mundagurra]|uniref:Ankyrin het domain-containing protein n=1 Tax=Fusarium mundagurra TaxID=1567541 RepID=A0A8H5Y0E1_9HYPO|nr:ankyrin het domain-containing protein [Fusarium mundagurra]